MSPRDPLDGPASRPARHAIDAAVALAIVALAWEPNFAHGFVNYNESGQHLAAIAALERGERLFRDVFVQYGPLHYMVPAWLFARFGAGFDTLRAYFLAGEIASLLAAFALARTWIRPRVFAWAAGLLVVACAHVPFWSTRWGGVRFAFVYLTLLALLRSRASPRPVAWWTAAGVASALGFLHTYDAGAVAGAAALLFAGHALWRERARLLPFVAAYAAGVVATLLPFAIVGLARGTLGAYLDQLPLASPGRAWLQPFDRSDLAPIVWLPGALLAASAARLLERAARGRWVPQRHLPLALVTTSGGLLYAAAFRAIRGPQLEMSLPLALLVAVHGLAVACSGALQAGRAPRQRALAAAALAAGLVLLATLELRPYAGGPSSWLRYQLHKSQLTPRNQGAQWLDEGFRAIDVPGTGRSRVPARQAAEIEGTVAALQRELRPDEPFFAYPDLGLFYALADRPAPTRFHIAVLAAARDDWSDELRRLLERAPPRIALRSRGLSTLARATRHGEEYLPDVARTLQLRYEPLATIGGLELRRRRPEAAADAP